MKKLKRLAGRGLAFLLSAVLLLPLLGAAQAAETIITIHTPDELADLARNCELDTWSRGKTVRLMTDIDLSAAEGFTPIPTFGGTFEGNGHTISGLALSEGTSYQGLFRFIQKQGVVQDLHVKGSVSAVGSRSCLGGLAGSNAGVITGCSFQGSVSGEEQVGGLVGINEAGGSIFRSWTEGCVLGASATGGIVGENLGTVTACTNRSQVNTVLEAEATGLDDLELSAELLVNSELETIRHDTTTDTGGIAGCSSGTLQGCRNEGRIGYPHVGYNVGGIVGRTSGHMDGCRNLGTILGRKDVGGIAGQMIPNIRLVFSPDTIAQLRAELDTLSSQVNRTLDHVSQNREAAAQRLERISEYAQTATDHAADLAEQTVDWADNNLDELNNLSDMIADTLDRLADITADSGETLDQAADGIDRLEAGLKDLGAAMDLGEDGLDTLARTVQDLRNANEYGQDGMEQVADALRALAEAWVIQDPDALNRALSKLQDGLNMMSRAAEDISDAIDTLTEILEGGDAAGMPDALRQLRQGMKNGAAALRAIEAGVSGVFGNIRLDWNSMKQGLRSLASAMDSFADMGEDMDAGLRKLKKALGQFSDMAGELENSTDDLVLAMDLFEGVSRDLSSAADQIHQLLQDLADREPISFDTFGPEYHELGDRLHSAVSSIGEELDGLRGELDGSGDELSADVRALDGQMHSITELLLDAITNLRDAEDGKPWKDVSEAQVDEAVLGKARGCVNTGAVEGDLNVGGVAGTMSIENTMDPEADVEQVGERSFDFRYETLAILQACVNQGAVTAKKSSAGGIVGQMDLGHLLDCENYGSVDSTDGDYVGGIAGYSSSSIRSCWAKTMVSGGNYVGGIAGYASRLYDCTAMVTIGEADGYAGAVAGDWDREEGFLSGNRFVRIDQAGVDGVSYASQAEPVDYLRLIEDEAVPEPFRILAVRYEADGEEVLTNLYRYGDQISDQAAPQVPLREGYCGLWSPLDEETITRDHVVEAVYTPYITTLACQATRSPTHAVFLAEGTFQAHNTLSAELLERTETLERWSVHLDGEGGQTGRIRFAAPEEWEAAKLWLMDGDTAVPLQAEREGSYLVFAVESTSFTLCAERDAGSLWPALLAGAAVCAAGAVLVIFLWKRTKKERSAPRDQEVPV